MSEPDFDTFPPGEGVISSKTLRWTRCLNISGSGLYQALSGRTLLARCTADHMFEGTSEIMQRIISDRIMGK